MKHWKIWVPITILVAVIVGALGIFVNCIDEEDFLD